jgi:hypothetical protein
MLWMLKLGENNLEEQVGLRDVWLSLCSTYIGLIVIMWWAWTHVYHQGSKHGWCVSMVGPTCVRHLVSSCPYEE